MILTCTVQAVVCSSFPCGSAHANSDVATVSWTGEPIMLKLTQLLPYSFPKEKGRRNDFYWGEYPMFAVGLHEWLMLTQGRDV